MKRVLTSIVISLFLIGTLSGCWDLKNPQDINYYTAVGFDYVDDQYLVYVQLIDFSTIAKQETGKPQGETPIWVGHGTGDTAANALNNLYDTAQFRVFYGHVNAIVYSENVLKKNFQHILDLQNRYYELKYTPWVYGTKEPIDRLFSVTSIFNLSPSLSLLHEPRESFDQKSTIPETSVREFLSNLREPASTVIMPAIGINKSSWSKGKGSDPNVKVAPDPFLDIEGVYVFHESQFKGRFEQNNILGLRWIRHETNRSPLLIRKDGTIASSLSIEQPATKITPIVDGDEIQFKVSVKASAVVIELLEAIPEEELEKLAANHIRSEILDLYKEGLAIGADLLGLEHALYRKKNRAWKQARESGPFELSPESVDIDVEVVLRTTGKLKYR